MRWSSRVGRILVATLAAGSLLAVTVSTVFAATLTSSEQRVAAAVDRAVPDALALLERSVNVNSGTMNFAGVRASGRLFAPEFERLGFETEWSEGQAFGRAGHLIARRSGRAQAPRVLLIGHLDTVFEPDSPFQRYEKISETSARGPGVTDMKGGIVVMLVALGALHEAKLLDRVAVTVVLTGDEERAGSPIELARRDLVAAADWADVAIGFEDGDGDPQTAVTSRRSSGSWRLRTSGRAAHSSQIFRDDIGDGAIFEVARILAAFRDSLGSERYLTFNPGVIVGGTEIAFDPAAARGTAFGKNNVIAESTFVAGDLRALTIEQRVRAQATMRRIVSASRPHAAAEITFEDRYPPLAPSPGNDELLALFDQASRDLGFGAVEAVDPARAGAADVSFTQGHVEMAMDGIGLMGDGGHTVSETADLSTLPIQAKRTAVMLLRLAERWKKQKR